MDDFRLITVSLKGKGKTLSVHNPTSYPLIGKGKQGAVFRLSEDRCVKIFLKTKNVKLEKEAMLKCQGMSFMPKFFESGKNYIIMEYIDGTPLLDYIKEQGTIHESITKQLVTMKKEMKRLKFTNLDRHIGRHVFIDNNQVVKVVDHASSYDCKPIPVRLLDTLSELALIDQFLEQVKSIDSELYAEWKNFLNNPRE